MKMASDAEEEFDVKPTACSITDFDGKLDQSLQMLPKPKLKETYHEILQRIDEHTQSHEREIYNYYQQSWFSVSLEKFKIEDRSREERIEITRHEFIRYIQQLHRGNVGYWKEIPASSVKCITGVPMMHRKHQFRNLVISKYCEVEECGRLALPCAQHCTLHIMLNSRQVLFEYCTAKFADNTQCCVPVFDIIHELPLCLEHARKRNYYKMNQETRPKKIRKKVKPSAMIRPQKRNKKRRRPISVKTSSGVILKTSQFPKREITSIAKNDSKSSETVEDLHVPDQVLEINENGLEQALATQAHLLEETDITTVLNTMQVDELNDIFAINRNGEYEPSREETEELEKALAEVDNDINSLEKLTQSQGLLDPFLDDHSLSEDIPKIFHNGYMPCRDGAVAQTSLYLLPVQPHSNS